MITRCSNAIRSLSNSSALSLFFEKGERAGKLSRTAEKVILVALVLFAGFFSYLGGMIVFILLAGAYTYRHFSLSKTPSKIRLFCGDQEHKGVSIESLRALEKSIQGVYSKSLLALCYDRQMIASEWGERDLLVFPGGKCSEWNALLSQNQQKNIFRWFNRGGRVLGICAGGYYCSNESEYQLNLMQKMSCIRQISLFPGKCIGPAYSSQIRIVKVRWEKNQKEGYVAIIGGGCFIPADKNIQGEYAVLARYIEEPAANEIAVVSCRKGTGRAVLSGPHWEFGQEHLEDLKSLFPIEEINQMQQQLAESAAFRRKCFKYMLEELYI